jgi:hypothetical protein
VGARRDEFAWVAVFCAGVPGELLAGGELRAKGGADIDPPLDG